MVVARWISGAAHETSMQRVAQQRSGQNGPGGLVRMHRWSGGKRVVFGAYCFSPRSVVPDSR